MTTIIEAAEIINNEFKYCYAHTNGASIQVTVRAKKSDVVYIQNGKVSYKGKCGSVAVLIAERLGLETDF